MNRVGFRAKVTAAAAVTLSRKQATETSVGAAVNWF